MNRQKPFRFAVVPALVAALLGSVLACNNTPAPDDEGSATSGSASDPTPPCPNAVLHQATDYTSCQGGHLANMQQDLWCCEDGSMKTTDTVMSDTDVPCGSVNMGDAGGDAPDALPTCTVSYFPPSGQVIVSAAGGASFQAIASPSDCTLTVTSEVATPSGTSSWQATPSGDPQQVTVWTKAGQVAPAVVNVSWSCTCPRKDALPATGTDSVNLIE